MLPLPPESPLHRWLASLRISEASFDGGLPPLVEFNPNHDARGRFASKRGGGGVMVGGTEFSQDEIDAVRSWQAAFDNVDDLQLAWRRMDALRRGEGGPAPSDGNLLGYRVFDFESAVSKSPSVKEGTVYRGIQERLNGAELTGEAVAAQWGQKVGQTIHFKDPVSTSPDFYTASRFGNTLFEIQHAGKAKDISPLSQYPGFKEAVMPPSSFVVSGVRKGPDLTSGVFGPHSPVSSTIVTLISTDLVPGGVS